MLTIAYDVKASGGPVRGFQNLRAGNNCSRRLNNQTARPDQEGLRCLKTEVLPATQIRISNVFTPAAV